MSNMNLLVVILKHEDLVSEICKELVEEGIHGGTIVDGTGMASVVEKMDDLPIFGMLRSILADDDELSESPSETELSESVCPVSTSALSSARLMCTVRLASCTEIIPL